MTPLRYFDHASTSWPKPPAVLAAVEESLGAGTGLSRDEYTSLAAGVRRFAGASDDAFCRMTTGGRNAIERLMWAVLRAGDLVVTTTLDHDAVRETVEALAAHGVRHEVVPLRPGAHAIHPDDFRQAIEHAPALVLVTHASNVTGALQPIETFAEICCGRDVPLVVDTSQTIGRHPIEMTSLGLAGMTTSIHKALRGPRRTGLLLVSSRWRARWTERMGCDADQHAGLFTGDPSGDVSTAHLRGALAAVAERVDLGLNACVVRERRNVEVGLEMLQAVPSLELFGPTDPDARLSIFGFRYGEEDGRDTAARLRSQGWWVGGGTQSSQWIHEALETGVHGGVCRISLGPPEILEALDDLVRTLCAK